MSCDKHFNRCKFISSFEVNFLSTVSDGRNIESRTRQRLDHCWSVAMQADEEKCLHNRTDRAAVGEWG